jgi:hypothetical protein
MEEVSFDRGLEDSAALLGVVLVRFDEVGDRSIARMKELLEEHVQVVAQGSFGELIRWDLPEVIGELPADILEHGARDVVL